MPCLADIKSVPKMVDGLWHKHLYHYKHEEEIGVG